MKKTLFVALVAAVAIFATSCKPKAEAPKAMFEYEVDANDVTLVQFTNLSKNATAYKWEFGDGQTSTETNPKHTYAESGTYTVTLTATGEGGTANYSESVSLTVPKIKIDGKFDDWDKLASDPTMTSATRPAEGFYESRYALMQAYVTTDENYMYFSLEFQSPDPDMIHVQQFDILIDADGNYATGKKRDDYILEFGMEYLVQYGDELGKLEAKVEDASEEGIAFWMDWAKYQVYYYGESAPETAAATAPNDICDRVADAAKGTTRVEGRVLLSYFSTIGLSNNSTWGFKCSSQGWAATTGQLPTPLLNEQGGKQVVPAVKFKM